MGWQVQHFSVIQQDLIAHSNLANIFPLVSTDSLNFIFQGLKSCTHATAARGRG